jgi:hypothetical protein
VGVEAWRGAAALLRSTLEKTLIAKGYERDGESNLYRKIEAAGADGVITSGRRQRAVAARASLHRSPHASLQCDVDAVDGPRRINRIAR